MHGAILLMLSLLAATEPVTVRVRETRGGPQIHVDGRPVPPRFFFGSMNRGTITAESEWTSHAFEFTPGAVDGTGTLHFRFAHTRGEPTRQATSSFQACNQIHNSGFRQALIHRYHAFGRRRRPCGAGPHWRPWCDVRGWGR